jgi:tetratricopeptide (TPR) repeat protein
VSERVASEVEVRHLLALNRPEAAATMALRLVAEDPESARPRVLAAQALHQLGRSKEALEHARRAVELDPEGLDGYVELSLALGDVGRRRQASDAARKAVELAPMNPNCHALLVEALVHESGSPKTANRTALLGEMNRHANITMDLAPDSVLAHLMKAKATLAAGRPAMARTEARKALAIDPDNVVAHQILGLAAQQQGETSKASDHFLAAAKVDRPGSDHSLKLLRKVKESPQLGLGFGISLWIGLRLLLAMAESSENLVVVIGVVGTLLVAAIVGTRLLTRRAHSKEARDVLKRDRRLRRGVRRL